MGFMAILAKVLDEAGGARRIARLAHVASMQNQPVMRVWEILGRPEFQQLFLDRLYGLAGSQTGAIGDPKYMGVHRDGGFAERGVQNDVGGLSADPRQLLEFLTRRGDRARVPLEQKTTRGNDVLGLAVVQPDRLDIRRQTIDSQCQQRRRRIGGAN